MKLSRSKIGALISIKKHGKGNSARWVLSYKLNEDKHSVSFNSYKSAFIDRQSFINKLGV